MNNELCPICEEGQLQSFTETVEVNHMGKSGAVLSHYSECDACGSEQATAEDARFNKRAMIGFKKQVQGLLTGQQVKTLREKWGLKQSDAARVFGGGPVAFSKYEKDDVMQADAMDKLLRLAADVPMALHKLMQIANVEIKSSAQWQSANILQFKAKRAGSRVVKEQHLEYKKCYGD